MKPESIKEILNRDANIYMDKISQIVKGWERQNLTEPEIKQKFEMVETKLPENYYEEERKHATQMFELCKFDKEAKEFKAYSSDGQILEECLNSMDNYSRFMNIKIDILKDL